MEPGAAGGQEILNDIGGDLRRDEEITAALAHADVAHGFPRDAAAHQRTQEIPVAGGVAFEERSPQADQRGILIVEAVLFQIFGQVHQHLPFRVPIAAEGVQAGFVTEEKPGHFQLPGGEETGGGGDVAADTGVYFVPQLGQEEPILRVVGDFFNIASIHNITAYQYSTSFR